MPDIKFKNGSEIHFADEPIEIEIPGPPPYTDLIDKALDDEVPMKPFYPLRPSSAGHCGRRMAHDLMSYKGYTEATPEIKKPSVKRLLALGNAVEYHSIKNFDLLKKADPTLRVTYKQQVVQLFRLDPVGDETVGQLIEGSMDLCVMRTNTGGIIDVKSAKDKFSQAFKTYWDENTAKFNGLESLITMSDTSWYAPDLELFLKELNDPFFEDNFRQLNVYACTDFATQHNIDHASIYRYSKNDSRHIEIRFKPSQKLAKEFKDKCNEVNQAVFQKDPELVPKDYMLGSIKCAFCPYAAKCWNEDALKEYFNSFPTKVWPTNIAKLNDYSIDTLFNQYETLNQSNKLYDSVVLELTKKLVDAKVKKVKLDNGNVYELKYLKSPKPHFELRKSKI